MGISHVARGDNLVTNSPPPRSKSSGRSGASVPKFAHFPLLVGAGGEALSKRLGSLSLEQLRDDGIEPVAVAAYLAKIGASDPVEPRSDSRRTGKRVRFRQDRPRPRAFLAGRIGGAECQDPARHAVQRGGGIWSRKVKLASDAPSSPISASAATLPKWHGWSVAR